jgi:hypothetical protein
LDREATGWLGRLGRLGGRKGRGASLPVKPGDLGLGKHDTPKLLKDPGGMHANGAADPGHQEARVGSNPDEFLLMNVDFRALDWGGRGFEPLNQGTEL